VGKKWPQEAIAKLLKTEGNKVKRKNLGSRKYPPMGGEMGDYES